MIPKVKTIIIIILEPSSLPQDLVEEKVHPEKICFLRKDATDPRIEK